MKEDEMKIVIKAKEKMMAKIKARSKMSPFLIQSVKSSSKAFFCFKINFFLQHQDHKFNHFY